MRVIFCLPGKSYSGNFLMSWTALLNECLRRGIDIILSQRHNSNVYYVRAQCLGAGVLRGRHQKPFDGKIPYDYIMWIDSDQTFEPNQFFKLLSNKKDICGGLYLMDGGREFPVVKEWDTQYFEKEGTFKFLTPMDFPPDRSLMEVVYTGFGFLLVKYGVFESIEYPWFEPQMVTIGENISDFASEDVSFCLKARKAGFKIHVDPTVIVGHEKSQILHIPTATL